MSDYLLDTSIVMAHFLGDERAVRLVDHLAVDGILVCVITWLEFEANLKARGFLPRQRQDVVGRYRQTLAQTKMVDDAVVLAAMLLREHAPKRLPAMDSLIAGCAKVHGAVLVHRDKHMAAIPESGLKTIHLDDTRHGSTESAPLVREKAAAYRTRRKRS